MSLDVATGFFVDGLFKRVSDLWGRGGAQNTVPRGRPQRVGGHISARSWRSVPHESGTIGNRFHPTFGPPGNRPGSGTWRHQVRPRRLLRLGGHCPWPQRRSPRLRIGPWIPGDGARGVRRRATAVQRPRASRPTVLSRLVADCVGLVVTGGGGRVGGGVLLDWGPTSRESTWAESRMRCEEVLLGATRVSRGGGGDVQ